MNKTLVFDMDGTIADLYGVKNWLDSLRAEDASPYMNASPIYNPEDLNNLITAIKMKGWRIVVTTWLAKNASSAYDNLVREAKLAWLEKYNFPYDEIHMVKYGTPKVSCTKHYGGFQILVDDNADVRNEWTLGATIDATGDIFSALLSILCTP